MEIQFPNEHIDPRQDFVHFAINADAKPANDANRDRFVPRVRTGNNPLNSRTDSEHAARRAGPWPYLIFNTTE